jgi:hypothetical protein
MWKSHRVDSQSSLSRCKNAEIALDTNMTGNPDYFKAAGLLLRHGGMRERRWDVDHVRCFRQNIQKHCSISLGVPYVQSCPTSIQ